MARSQTVQVDTVVLWGVRALTLHSHSHFVELSFLISLVLNILLMVCGTTALELCY